LLRDASAIALSYTPFNRAAIAAAPLLQVAARIGVGFDTVEVLSLTECGIPLMVVGAANARSVAEHAVYFMFALAKRSGDMDRRVHKGISHDRLSGLPGEIFGKTVLIVGFGRIGSRTAPRCQALGMIVLSRLAQPVTQMPVGHAVRCHASPLGFHLGVELQKFAQRRTRRRRNALVLALRVPTKRHI